jgi:hypothetical protein
MSCECSRERAGTPPSALLRSGNHQQEKRMILKTGRHIHWQLMPSARRTPPGQLQVNDPTVLVQVPPHPPLFVKHSLVSKGRNENEFSILTGGEVWGSFTCAGKSCRGILPDTIDVTVVYDCCTGVACRTLDCAVCIEACVGAC